MGDDAHMSRDKKTPRRLERIFAFKVLYGLCFYPAPSEADLLDAFTRSPERPEGIDNEDSYAWTLVYGIWAQSARLDGIIASFSQNWRVERMGNVEKTILRIAVYEMLSRNHDVPTKVAINEAVEMSKQYSDDKSRGFVNGVLDAAARAFESGLLPDGGQKNG